MATLLDHLAALFPTAKRTTLRRMIDDGRVTVNGRAAAKASIPLSAGDQVEVTDRTSAAPKGVPVAAAPGIDIRYEDTDLLVINKPPGLLTSTTPGESRPTLLAHVQQYVAATSPMSRVGLIHRLDRDARGLLVFSKSGLAYHALKTQFFHHTVQRQYTAVCVGVPTPRAGQIDLALTERADGTVRPARKPAEGQRAVTDYETIRAHNKLSLIQLTLRTGRKHQIRVHLAHRGAPILGDPVYGTAPHNVLPLHLAAVRLGVTHPRTGRPIVIELPLPPEFTAKFA